MATAALLLDKAHFLPSPMPDQGKGPSLASRARSATEASREGAFSRISATWWRARPAVRSLRRAPRYVAAAGRGRRGPRGAVPLNPRAAAFVSPREELTTRPELPGGGGRSLGHWGSRWICKRDDCFLKVAPSILLCFSFSFLTSDWEKGGFSRINQVGLPSDSRHLRGLEGKFTAVYFSDFEPLNTV